MNILLCCDTKLSQHVNPLIKSILLNTRESVIFYMLSFDEIDLSKFIAPVNFIKIDKNEYNWLFVDGIRKTELTAECYLRIFAPEYLTKVDRIIYLDIDIIIEKDLSTLWSIDLKDKYIGMVPQLDPEFVYIENYENPYEFQSGVMLMDLNKIRSIYNKENIKLIHNQLKEIKKNNFNYDQGLISEIYKDKILTLSYIFNFNTYVLGYDYKHKRVVDDIDDDDNIREILGEEMSSSIVIFHYAGHESDKPWNKKNSRYYKYLGVL